MRDVLFPFARARLPAFVRRRGDDPEVARELAAVRLLAPGEEPLDVLARWLDEDRKATPLKSLQGLLWAEGYATGELRGHVYDDVAPALRALQARGVRLFVYSSGSVEAQRLLFGHSVAGDLTPLFEGYFDTRTGPKLEVGSYVRIAEAIRSGLGDAGELWFASDSHGELDAAQAAGLRTLSVAREGTGPVGGHPLCASFAELAELVR